MSTAHTASVNAISFAPHELGLALAAASSDGSVSIVTHTAEGGWHTEKVGPHTATSSRQTQRRFS